MKAVFKKDTLKDPQSEDGTYSSFTLNRNVEFCCDSFKIYCKKFTSWNYDHGKFSIVDKITYDGHSVCSIDYCPFCGEKIDYVDETTSNKIKRKKISQ